MNPVMAVAGRAAQAKMVARKPDSEVVCVSMWRWLAGWLTREENDYESPSVCPSHSLPLA